MRIDMTRDAMTLLRSLEGEGRPLWEAIERLRTNPAPPEALISPERPGRRELHVRVGLRGFWLAWEIIHDRSETVIRVALIEEN